MKTSARAGSAARLAGLALAAGAMLAGQPAHAAAGTGALTLRAQGTSTTTTLVLRDAGQDPGGKRRYAYELRVANGACHATLAGVVHRVSKTDATGDDSTFLRNGESVDTSVFRDLADGRQVTLTIDVSSPKPQYAGVAVDKAPAGCADWQHLDSEFYAR
ncbi:hypothetical protein [Burkholderia gladioli]|uniref:hypothetical protein n=1 Tax=Burkholderia gladioli TaxID=28095 RepID=UPI00163F92B3|nr:hypothetical protein [Burkholderia gladioli]